MKMFKKICVAGLACLLLCFGTLFIGCGSSNDENPPPVPPTIETPDTGNEGGETENPGEDNSGGETEKPPVEEEVKVDFSEVLASLKEFLADSGLLDTDLVSNLDDVLDIDDNGEVLMVGISADYLFSDDESMFDFSEEGFNVEVKNQNEAIVFTITKI